MKLLHAPLIGAEIFIVGFDWAADEKFPIDERQERFFSFIQPLPRHEPLVAYGKSLPPAGAGSHRIVNVTKNGFEVPIRQEWAARIKQEWDNNPAGQKQLERPALEAQGIKLLTPEELVQHYGL